MRERQGKGGRKEERAMGYDDEGREGGRKERRVGRSKQTPPLTLIV